jgi:hypothetical protein
MSRKFTVSLSVREGRAVGWMLGSSRGGAAAVGKSEFRSSVGVAPGEVSGVGEGVALGSRAATSKGVGVLSEGWKGVGVGEAFGATVIKIKGSGAAVGAAAGGVQAARPRIARRNAGRLRERRMREGRLICNAANQSSGTGCGSGTGRD